MAITKEVLYTNTEGLDVVDLNNAQRFARAQMADVWGFRLGEAGHPLNRSLHCNAIGDAGAPTPEGAANRSVKTLAGTIMQVVGSLTGDSPQTLAYYLAADELATTFAVGDATNPRWDIVTVQLAHADGDPEARQMRDNLGVITANPALNKRRNLGLTKTVTAGTPAASPVEPATPANHVKVFAVLIPALLGAGPILAANIRDYRMPLGLQTCDAWSTIMNAGNFLPAATWTNGLQGATPVARSANAAASLLHYPNGSHGYAQRLLALEVLVSETTSMTFLLQRALADGATGTFTTLDDASLTFQHTPAGNNVQFIRKSYSGTPIWVNGFESGYANRWDVLATPNNFTRLTMRCTAGATNEEVALVRFILAGGL